MRPNDDRNRIEKIQDQLEEAPKAARNSVKQMFDGVEGFRLPADAGPGAPDEMDYDEWERYAIDAHEWAVEEFQRRHAAALEALEEIPADEHPPLGRDRPDDRELRDEMDEQIFEAAQRLQDLAEAREWLGSFEEDY